MIEEAPALKGMRVARRRAALLVTSVVAVALIVASTVSREPANRLASLPLPEVSSRPTEAPLRWPAPLTEAQRARGFDECSLPDPVGLGPYAPYRLLALGRVAIPQKGGQADDGGYDVVIHFHGHRAVRKVVAQVARGVVFAGVDLGLGSGVYSQAFHARSTFVELLQQIEQALREHADDPRAHVRHLALTAWSAGYGAVSSILAHSSDRVDAVVLLDGLHAARVPGHARDGTAESVRELGIEPAVRYAEAAARGEGHFVFTFSEVDPVDYATTRATAKLLADKLGIELKPVVDDGPFGQNARGERGGAYLWGYRGGTERAHCAQVLHITQALHLLEQAWATPAMARDVPPVRAGEVSSAPQIVSP